MNISEFLAVRLRTFNAVCSRHSEVLSQRGRCRFCGHFRGEYVEGDTGKIEATPSGNLR